MSAHITNVADAMVQRRQDALPQEPPPLTSFTSEMEKDVVAEKRDLRMRQCFEKVMCEQLDIPNSYSSVACLIIRWKEELDQQLRCWEEVSNYGYTDHCIPANVIQYRCVNYELFSKHV